jgi:hypothetical protein
MASFRSPKIIGKPNPVILSAAKNLRRFHPFLPLKSNLVNRYDAWMRIPHILPIFVLLWPATAIAAGPPAHKPPADSQLCEVVIGKDVELIMLSGKQGQPPIYRREGSSLFFYPPGEYAITEIKLKGGQFVLDNQDRLPDRITLAPGKPARFDVKMPLTHSVVAKRTGRLLNLNYQLLDGDGRKYRNDRLGGDRDKPPQFAIYQGDEKIGAGSFEYG